MVIDFSKDEALHKALIFIDPFNGNKYKLLSKYSAGRIEYLHKVEQPDGFNSVCFKGIVSGWNDYFDVVKVINNNLKENVLASAQLIEAEPQYRIVN